MQSGAPPQQHPRGTTGPVLYQIDFTAVAAGKRVPTSKRRVRWRYGIANPEALLSGQTGTECRGEEHDITLVWSLTSGKRMVLADGHEVHFSNSRSNIFDYSWSTKGYVLKIVAHSTAPLSPTPGFRQYDFFVNGQSFFRFPKVFRLGLAPNDPRGQSSPVNSTMMAESTRRSSPGPSRGGLAGPRRSSSNIANLEAPGNPDEEEAYLQEAIRQSLNADAKPKAAAAAPAPPADLLDFGDSDPTPAAAVYPATSFGGIESIQSDPYSGGQHTAVNHAHQSFTSLPAITAGYGPPQSDFAAAAAQGALVVAAPSTGYGSYYIPQSNDPYGVGRTQPASNQYAGANPYALAPAPNPSLVPYQHSAPYQHTPAPAVQGNMYDSGSNPYGAPVSMTAAIVNPYALPPVSADMPMSSTNPYGAPMPSNPYLAPVPSNPYAAPVTTGSNGNGESADNKSSWTPPAPITTLPNPYDSSAPTQPYNAFNGGFVPPAVTPHAQQTPSSLGFGSPAPDFSGFTPAPGEKTNGFAPPSTPFGALTMNELTSGGDTDPAQDQAQVPQQSTSVVQSTFAKLASLDNFSVSSNADAKRSNPFESPANASVGGGRSLADMVKNKPIPAKEIMKAPMPAQAPLATAPTNAYGQYTAQYGMQTSGGFGQPQTQQPNTFGQVPTQTSHNQSNTFVPAPLQTPIQQSYDQYQQAQQPMIQQSYGQEAQPPTGLYGQQPPMQQQPHLQYGFNQQQTPPQTQPAYQYGQGPAYPPQPGYY